MPRERLMTRMRGDQFLGVHFALNIFVGTTLLWLLLHVVVGLNPVWAVASLVAASDPQVKEAFANFRGPLLNSVVGCVIGVLFLVVGSPNAWKLPLAMAASALLSSYVVRVPTMWRQGPTTAALVVASALTEHSSLTGFEMGATRVGEIMLGAMFGVIVSWLMSKVWPMSTAEEAAKA